MAEALAMSKAALAVACSVHYVYPSALFAWFLGSQAASFLSLKTATASKKPYQKRLFVFLQMIVIASYVAEAVLMCVHALVEQGWWATSDNAIYILMSILVWGFLEVAIIDTEKPVWYPYYGTWILSFVAEAILLSLSITSTVADRSKYDFFRTIIQGCRLFVFFGMPAGLMIARRKDLENSGEEAAQLLVSETQEPTYGSIPEWDNDIEGMNQAKARMQKKLKESGNWWTYIKSYSVFLPHIWPYGQKLLQLNMALVGVCLLVERVLNVLVPHQLGVVTDALMQGGGTIPWAPLCLYVLYRFMMSRAGVSAIQSYLWMPIDQYSHRSLTTAAYNHVMSLSYDFHTSRNTGEIWSSINQGRSVSGFIETFLFQVGPMMIDLCVAFAYFYILFDMYMALIVAVVSVSFLYVTAKLSARKNALRRELNHNARNEVGILVETISSWTTVNYFNRVPYEQTRYDRAVGLYQTAERKWTIGITVLGASQSLVFTLGLLAASFLAVYQVSRGVRPVGSFVTLLSYWAQLSIPLSFFADFLRRIQNQLLDSERLLELFETVPAMKDESDAIDLDTTKGEIEFENVSFSYDVRKPAISDMSFRVAPGTTVAFVGETGGGKTTCLKLLYRFYDVKSGSIKVDGHDIRGIKLDSFRKHIGVVPQDPQLFNDTIINNLKYANFDATDEEIHAACRAASIHDKIMSFPDGYLSKVGERGIKLSGGELQRISIARAMLKNPRIILLDEATSMIDMETEQHIQEAFQQLAKDRTMFIVAHRLSTIMNADMILVIKEGRIIERGSHEELLDIQGKYYRMWSRQSKPADPKPAESKKPLLIEDLFSMSAKDESYESEAMHSQGSRRLQIPESSNSVRRQSGPSTVTFSLPEQRAYWNFGYRQPPTNPRLAIPNHGILKNTSHPQVPNGSARNVGVSMKSLFQLKPDAKEFVPRRLSVTEQDPAPEVGSNASSQPQKAEEEVVSSNDNNQQTTTETASEPEPIGTESSTNDTALETLAVQENAQLDEKYPALDVTRSSSTSTATTIIPESSGEVATDVDPVSDAPAGTRKRRRRVRRRSSKKLGTSASSDETLEADQSSPSDGAESDVPDAVVADPTPTKVQRSEGENVEILNGNASKPKRRFRNGSKSKNQGTEPATEEPSTATALSSLAPMNGAVVQVRPRSESIGQNGRKLVKAPASMENKRPIPSANVPSDLSRRKASINGQVQEQKSAAPRKAQKAPLGGGSGNSTSEA